MLTILIDPRAAHVDGFRYAQPDELIASDWAFIGDDPTIPGVDPIPTEMVGQPAWTVDGAFMVPWPEDPRLDLHRAPGGSA